MKKRIIAIAVCALTIAIVGRAETTSKTILAEQLLEAMEMKKTNEHKFEVMKQSMPAMMKTMGADPTSENTQEIMQKVLVILSEEMSWDKLKGDFIDMYAETYSEEELKGLTEFYKSPIGKKFIIKQPELTQRSVQMSQQKMMSVIPKIQAMIKQHQ